MADCVLSLKASCSVPASDLKLGLRFDGSLVQELDLSPAAQVLEHRFSDSQGEHTLEIELWGKLPEHTKIDSQGVILEDVLIYVTDICVDGIDLGTVFEEHARYHHDHNGTTDAITQTFHGIMGCNGCVRLTFASPVYQWLLEHL